jgi:hypothetical protein
MAKLRLGTAALIVATLAACTGAPIDLPTLSPVASTPAATTPGATTPGGDHARRDHARRDHARRDHAGGHHARRFQSATGQPDADAERRRGMGRALYLVVHASAPCAARGLRVVPGVGHRPPRVPR